MIKVEVKTPQICDKCGNVIEPESTAYRTHRPKHQNHKRYFCTPCYEAMTL